MKKHAATLSLIVLIIVLMAVLTFAEASKPVTVKVVTLDEYNELPRKADWESDNTIDKSAVLKCTYVAGVARETQNIRQNTHHDFERFKKEVMLIYIHDAGLDVLLNIARQVFESFDESETSDYIGKVMFDECYDLYTKGVAA